MDETQTSNSSPDQSGPESNGSEAVLKALQLEPQMVKCHSLETRWKCLNSLQR